MQLRLLCTFALYRLEPYWTKGTCGLRGFVAKFKTLKNMVYHAMHDTSIFHPPAIPLRKWYIWQCDVFLWICDHCDACIIKIYNSLATAYLRKEGWWEAHVAREWRWIRWWHEGQYCSLQSCCPLTYHCSWISNGSHKKSKLLYRTLTIILPILSFVPRSPSKQLRLIGSPTLRTVTVVHLSFQLQLKMCSKSILGKSMVGHKLRCGKVGNGISIHHPNCLISVP